MRRHRRQVWGESLWLIIALLRTCILLQQSNTVSKVSITVSYLSNIGSELSNTIQNSEIPVQSSAIKAQSSVIQVKNSKIQVQSSVIQNQSAAVQVQSLVIQDQRSVCSSVIACSWMVAQTFKRRDRQLQWEQADSWTDKQTDWRNDKRQTVSFGIDYLLVCSR